MHLLLLALLSTTSPLELSGHLAQIEKHANHIHDLAITIQKNAEHSAFLGRPYGLAMMESDLASVQIHLSRMNSALQELELAIDSAP